MSGCAFNPLPKGDYSNLFIKAAFSGKTSFPVKYLPAVSNNKAEILAVCLSKSY